MKLMYQGTLHLDDGKLAVMPLKILMACIVDKLGLNEDDLAKLQEQMVVLNLHGENIGADVYQSVSIENDGSTFKVPVIGINPEKHIRFLNDDEMTLAQFSRKHRCIRFGLKDDMPEADTIRREYKDYVLRKVTRHNPELDEALGIDPVVEDV